MRPEGGPVTGAAEESRGALEPHTGPLGYSIPGKGTWLLSFWFPVSLLHFCISTPFLLSYALLLPLTFPFYPGFRAEITIALLVHVQK